MVSEAGGKVKLIIISFIVYGILTMKEFRNADLGLKNLRYEMWDVRREGRRIDCGLRISSHNK
jgi:hypothetical protein